MKRLLFVDRGKVGPRCRRGSKRGARDVRLRSTTFRATRVAKAFREWTATITADIGAME
jgi:hypothetical protein